MEEGYNSWLNPLLFRLGSLSYNESIEIQMKNTIYMTLAKKL